MTVLEFATKTANRMQNEFDFNMAAILKWFDAFKDGDKVAVFVSTNNNSQDAEFYCNAPNYNVALQDIISETPFGLELKNVAIDEFQVSDEHSTNYYRKWYLVKLG